MSEKSVTYALDEEMASMRAEVDSWRASVQESLRSRQQRFEEAGSSNEATLQALSAQEASLRDMALTQKRNAELARIEVSAANTGVQRLSNQLHSIPKQLQTLQTQLQQAQDRLQKHQEELKESVKVNAKRLQALTQGALFFKRRLGLEFEVIDASGSDEGEGRQFLRVILSGLGDAHDCIGSFLIAIDEDLYSVEQCDPDELDRAALDDAIAQLNRDNDFSFFVQRMRRMFKQHFAASATTNADNTVA